MGFTKKSLLEAIYEKTALTADQVDYYFATHENEKDFVMKLRGEHLERKTWADMCDLARENEGGYDSATKTWFFPKEQTAALEAEKLYDLAKSMKGEMRQLVPILKAADGSIIDGLHRLEIDPKAFSIVHKHIKTAVQRALARLTVNFNRRVMSSVELDKDIGFLIGAGLNPQQIEDITGISLSTVKRHIPEALKSRVKIEAGKAGGAATAEAYRLSQDASLTRDQKPETQDTILETPSMQSMQEQMMTQIVECEGCHKPHHRSRLAIKGGLLLCPECRGEKPRAAPKKAEPREYKPKETADFRRALMKPGVSKMDTAVFEELAKRGHKVEFQKPVCLEKTVVDFIVDGMPWYLDGRRVHMNKEWTDDKIRNRLAVVTQQTVHAITYERYKKSGPTEIVDEIEEALT